MPSVSCRVYHAECMKHIKSCTDPPCTQCRDRATSILLTTACILVPWNIKSWSCSLTTIIYLVTAKLASRSQRLYSRPKYARPSQGIPLFAHAFYLEIVTWQCSSYWSELALWRLNSSLGISMIFIRLITVVDLCCYYHKEKSLDQLAWPDILSSNIEMFLSYLITFTIYK